VRYVFLNYNYQLISDWKLYYLFVNVSLIIFNATVMLFDNTDIKVTDFTHGLHVRLRYFTCSILIFLNSTSIFKNNRDASYLAIKIL
jgi:hypothetical protein